MKCNVKSLLAVFLVTVFVFGLLSALPFAASAETVTSGDAVFANASSFVPGEEYVLVMNATKAWPGGVYVSASTTYCLVAEVYKSGLNLGYPPATAGVGAASMWRISYGKTTGTVTLWSDNAGKFLNMTTAGATLSDTPQELNAVVSGGTLQIYIIDNGTNYYLRFTRGTGSDDHGRWVVGSNSSSSIFTLRSVRDVDSAEKIRPMRELISGGRYILGRSGVKDKAGITAEICVIAAPKENGLQYGPRPENLARADDSLWTITKNQDGTFVFYSEVAGKYLNLSASAASLSDTPQNLSVTLSGRKMTVYTVIDGATYYLRFSNALSTGSGWLSGTSTSSHEFTLYTLQTEEREYDNAGRAPLYSVACFADLHVDYGIQSWETPLRQGTVKAVEYLKNTLGGANVILVGGDIVSNNDWGAEWTNENLKKTMDTVYSTMLTASTDGAVLPITGNHDSEPGNTAGGTEYAGNWDPYLLENVGEFDSVLRNSESKFNEVLCYRYRLNGIDFININTPYQPSGDAATLYVEQAEWLAEELAAIGKTRTVVVQCHYQLNGGSDAFVALRDVVEEYPNVLYCYGHLHGDDSYYAWYETSELVRPLGASSQNEDNSWTAEGPISCHMGSMGYYRNQYQNSALGSAEPVIVQFLKMDFYEDHITFRYYNVGEKTGDPEVTEITSYTVTRNMKQLTDPVPEESRDLSVTFTDVAPSGAVYSLDMVWENSDLSFDYVGGTQGAWNPADHTFGETTGAGWVDDDLKVTVVNHSNAAVKVSVGITDSNAEDGLTVTSDKTTETLATAEGTTRDNAPKGEFILTIEGTPTASVTKVATATVSFAKPE